MSQSLVEPSTVINPEARTISTTLNLIYWKDPGDTVIDNQVISTWSGTKLVAKQGSYPTSPTDGTVLVDNREKDKYHLVGFKHTKGASETWKYRLFPYSVSNKYSLNDNNKCAETSGSGVSLVLVPESNMVNRLQYILKREKEANTTTNCYLQMFNIYGVSKQIRLKDIYSTLSIKDRAVIPASHNVAIREGQEITLIANTSQISDKICDNATLAPKAYPNGDYKNIDYVLRYTIFDGVSLDNSQYTYYKDTSDYKNSATSSVSLYQNSKYIWGVSNINSKQHVFTSSEEKSFDPYTTINAQISLFAMGSKTATYTGSITYKAMTNYPIKLTATSVRYS